MTTETASTDAAWRLNQVDLEAVGALGAAVAADPANGATTWAASVAWKGAFRTEATIRHFDPLPSDEPARLGGTDTAPNPVEQVLAALGNCLAVGYAANASTAGIRIDDLTIDIAGDIDLTTFLGIADGNAGFGSINALVTLHTDADDDAVAELHRTVVGTSPVGHTLNRAVPLTVELT